MWSQDSSRTAGRWSAQQSGSCSRVTSYQGTSTSAIQAASFSHSMRAWSAASIGQLTGGWCSVALAVWRSNLGCEDGESLRAVVAQGGEFWLDAAGDQRDQLCLGCAEFLYMIGETAVVGRERGQLRCRAEI